MERDKKFAQSATKATETDLSTGLTQAEADIRLAKYGYNEVPEKRENPFLRFLKKFWGLSAWLLELIIILSWSLNNLYDVYLVAALLLFNAIIGFAQEQNASDAVDALKSKLQVSTNVLRDGAWKILSARELVPGDVVLMKIGDFVPADVKISQGEAEIDQSALTGESVEVEKKAGESVYSGSIVRRGDITGIVVLTGANTYFGRTIQLVQIAKPKLHIESVISKVVQWLLIIVALILTVVFSFSVLNGDNPLEILPLMLILLLGAIPVALPAMFSVSMALGSSELVKRGVLVTRLSAPDDASRMDVLCVDKTGTMTVNRLSVAKLIPSNGYTEDDILTYGAMASQEASPDSIDSAFINAAKARGLMDASYERLRFIPFDPKSRRTEALVKVGDDEFRVMKGSVNAIAGLCGLGRKEMAGLESETASLAKNGYRTLAVAKAGKRNEIVGLVALHDPPREDSRSVVDELRELGVSVKMLTGDALPIAKEIAKSVGIGGRISHGNELEILDKKDPDGAAELVESRDGFAEIYPEDKYLIVKGLQSRGHVVGMTGDGVNDAPALKQAEVGTAVSSATDVAKGAASIVLTQEGLREIVEPIRIGRMMFQRMNTWVLNKMSKTILQVCFIALAFFITGNFIISSTAMILLVFMVDFVTISLSTDNASWSKKPTNWDINGLARIAAVIGLILVAEAFGLLYLGLRYFGFAADPGALSTFTFEILFYLTIFLILALRERRHLWDSAPSGTLLAAIIADAILAAVFATYGMLGLAAIPIAATAMVIGYSLAVTILINDLVKFALFNGLNASHHKT